METEIAQDSLAKIAKHAKKFIYKNNMAQSTRYLVKNTNSWLMNIGLFINQLGSEIDLKISFPHPWRAWRSWREHYKNAWQKNGLNETPPLMLV